MVLLFVFDLKHDSKFRMLVRKVKYQMSYRFLKITTFYQEFLDAYYRRNPQVRDLGYAEQKDHLMARGYGWADHFERNLRALGVDAHEVVVNAVPLQRQWAVERGRDLSGRDVVLAQIMELRPDVLMLQDTFYAPGGWVRLARERTPSIRQVIGWCSAPFAERHLENLRPYDYILACTPYFVRYFAKRGIRSHLMYHAFEPGLLPLLAVGNGFPAVDLIFLGSLAGGEGYHNERLRIIESLIARGTELSVHTRLPAPPRIMTAAQQALYVAAKASTALGLGSMAARLPVLQRYQARTGLPRHPSFSSGLRAAVRPPEYGLDMLKALSRAKIGLNSHIDVAGEYAGNSRLFEVTGAGACLVTDWKKNLGDLFEPGREVVAYQSAGECIEKITWLLGNPASLKEIARAGQARTLKDHSFRNRAAQLDAIIREEFGRGGNAENLAAESSRPSQTARA